MNCPAENVKGTEPNGTDFVNIVAEQVAATKEILKEAQLITNNKKLEDTLKFQEVTIERYKQVLDKKRKDLHELNEILKQKKAEVARNKNQRLINFDVMAEIFKDTKKFTSKAGHEIQQTFTSLGFDIEYECVDGQVTIKIQKDERWFQLGLDEHLTLELVNMHPRHDRFEEIKTLFSSTRNIAGLFSIYNWSFD